MFDTSENKDEDKNKTKVSKLRQINMFISDFANHLLKCETETDCKLISRSISIIDFFLIFKIILLFQDVEILKKLKEMGPSAIDVEVRSMALDMGGSIELLNKFMEFLLYVLSTNKNFELASAYLALFLKVSKNLEMKLS
jgi:hypothetical protein